MLPLVHREFDFRVLRENRRVTNDENRRSEIERFHEVLSDISLCRDTPAVREFLVASYVRGAELGSAELVPFEGYTAVFTKRRYRDAWNRVVLRRIAREHNHSLKIKARVRAQGARGQNWYGEKRTKVVRSKARTQNAWLLHLAGDHHSNFEDKPLTRSPHLMRCMLNANLAVDQRFANGSSRARFASARCSCCCSFRMSRIELFLCFVCSRLPRTQGRLLHWGPAVDHKKAVPASHPEISARFVKETAVSKPDWLPDIDMIDCPIREERMRCSGSPMMLQLPLVPSYVLTLARCAVRVFSFTAHTYKFGWWEACVSPICYRVMLQGAHCPQDAGALHQARRPWLLGGRVRARTRVCDGQQGHGPGQLRLGRPASE